MIPEDIQKLAALSRIELAPGEAEKIAQDAEAILDYVSQVGEISAAGEGDAHMALINVMREDGTPHETGAYTEALLKNAPDEEEGYVSVRTVIEK